MLCYQVSIMPEQPDLGLRCFDKLIILALPLGYRSTLVTFVCRRCEKPTHIVTRYCFDSLVVCRIDEMVRLELHKLRTLTEVGRWFGFDPHGDCPHVDDESIITCCQINKS